MYRFLNKNALLNCEMSEAEEEGLYEDRQTARRHKNSQPQNETLAPWIVVADMLPRAERNAGSARLSQPPIGIVEC